MCSHFSICLINSQPINSPHLRAVAPAHACLHMLPLCRSVLGQCVSVGSQANLHQQGVVQR